MLDDDEGEGEDIKLFLLFFWGCLELFVLKVGGIDNVYEAKSRTGFREEVLRMF